MSEQLYKVHFAYEYQDPNAPHPFHGPQYNLLANHIAFLDRGLMVREWLRANDRYHHFINIYDNGPEGICAVFSNRDTALMLKLALS